MNLRELTHGLLESSYEVQFLAKVWEATLDDLNHDLQCEQCGYFSNADIIAGTFSRTTMETFCIRISSHLDGLITQKTADSCRISYGIVLRFYPDIEEINNIYNHLYQYYKYKRRPLPIK